MLLDLAQVYCAMLFIRQYSLDAVLLFHLQNIPTLNAANVRKILHQKQKNIFRLCRNRVIRSRIRIYQRILLRIEYISRLLLIGNMLMVVSVVEHIILLLQLIAADRLLWGTFKCARLMCESFFGNCCLDRLLFLFRRLNISHSGFNC